MIRKIALEEHFLCPGFEDYWRTTVGNVDAEVAGSLLKRELGKWFTVLERRSRARVTRTS